MVSGSVNITTAITLLDGYNLKDTKYLLYKIVINTE